MNYLYDIPVIPNQSTTINLLDIKAITDIKLVLYECDCNHLFEEIFTKKEKKRYRIRYAFTIAFFDESYMQIFCQRRFIFCKAKYPKFLKNRLFQRISNVH